MIFSDVSRERFAAKVERTPTCWLWRGAKERSTPGRDYGLVVIDGVRLRAHRAAWLMERGEIPEGLGVLHRCDTPACVRIDHLYLGTQKQNVADAVARGRWTQGTKPARRSA